MSRRSASRPVLERGIAGQTAVVFAGHTAATALGLIANLITMRVLGPEGFGVVVVATTLLTVLWLLTGRGVDQALVRCLALLDAQDHAMSVDGLRPTVHQIKLFGGAMLVVAVLPFAPLIKGFFLGAEGSSVPILLGVVGSLAATLWSYAGASLQAGRAFGRFAWVQVINSAARLAATAGLAAVALLTPAAAMLATGASYLLAAAVGYTFSAPAARSLRGQASLRPMIYQSARWLVVSSLIHILYTRLDHLMLSRMVGPEATGLYGAAVTFIQIVDLLTLSLLTVVLPNFCAQQTPSGLRREAARALRISGALALLISPAYYAASPVLRWLLGEEFLATADLFEILFFGAVFTLLTHPLQAALHARGETHLLTALDVTLLLANGVGNLLAIPRYGAVGAAAVALATRAAGGLLLSAMVAWRLRRTEEPVTE